MTLLGTYALDELKNKLLAGDAARLVKLARDVEGDGLIRGLQKTFEEPGAPAMPLDLAFLFHSIKNIDEYFGEDELPCQVFESRNALEVWNKTPRIYRSIFPKVGDIVIWCHYKKGKPLKTGHVGIITEMINRSEAIVAEGNNVSSFDEIKHKKQGFNLNKRSLRATDKMKILGYISPWKDV